MKFRADKDGKVHVVYSPAQLKRRRMLIRAGIGIVLRTIEERTLMEMLIYRDREAFDEWFDCFFDSDDWMNDLRRFFWDSGRRHWRLKERPR